MMSSSSSSSRPRAPSASSLPPPSSDLRTRSGSSASSQMATPITHTQTEPALSAATQDFDVGRNPPSSQSSTDTIMSSPRQQPRQYEGMSELPVEGEELARTTTSSSGFSTQSGNGGVEVGSKRDREWKEHFDLDEEEELVDSQSQPKDERRMVSSALTIRLSSPLACVRSSSDRMCSCQGDSRARSHLYLDALCRVQGQHPRLQDKGQSAHADQSSRSLTPTRGPPADVRPSFLLRLQVHFPFTSVTAIVPKMTALVIPNAIEFTTDENDRKVSRISRSGPAPAYVFQPHLTRPRP